MKLQTAIVLVCLFRTSFSLPVQIGILASNSNEILRLNGLTFATLGQTQLQASSILPQYVLQQQQFNPQLMNLNPQLGVPFGPQMPQLMFPTQGNQLTPMFFPNGQQELPGLPQDPNAPIVPQQAQNPMQMVPQYQYPLYRFPQQPVMQGFPYYMQPRVVQQPNNGQVNQAQQNLERTTQRPYQPLQQSWTKKEPTTPPTVHRGDASGPGVDEGHPNFPFLFEP